MGTIHPFFGELHLVNMQTGIIATIIQKMFAEFLIMEWKDFPSKLPLAYHTILIIFFFFLSYARILFFPFVYINTFQKAN